MGYGDCCNDTSCYDIDFDETLMQSYLNDQLQLLDEEWNPEKSYKSPSIISCSRFMSSVNQQKRKTDKFDFTFQEKYMNLQSESLISINVSHLF